jgi:hypothetical protein
VIEPISESPLRIEWDGVGIGVRVGSGLQGRGPLADWTTGAGSAARVSEPRGHGHYPIQELVGNDGLHREWLLSLDP